MTTTKSSSPALATDACCFLNSSRNRRRVKKGVRKKTYNEGEEVCNFAVLISMISQINLLYYLPIKMNNCFIVLVKI